MAGFPVTFRPPGAFNPTKGPPVATSQPHPVRLRTSGREIRLLMGGVRGEAQEKVGDQS